MSKGILFISTYSKKTNDKLDKSKFNLFKYIKISNTSQKINDKKWTDIFDIISSIHLEDDDNEIRENLHKELIKELPETVNYCELSEEVSDKLLYVKNKNDNEESHLNNVVLIKNEDESNKIYPLLNSDKVLLSELLENIKLDTLYIVDFSKLHMTGEYSLKGSAKSRRKKNNKVEKRVEKPVEEPVEEPVKEPIIDYRIFKNARISNRLYNKFTEDITELYFSVKEPKKLKEYLLKINNAESILKDSSLLDDCNYKNSHILFTSINSSGRMKTFLHYILRNYIFSQIIKISEVYYNNKKIIRRHDPGFHKYNKIILKYGMNLNCLTYSDKLDYFWDSSSLEFELISIISEENVSFPWFRKFHTHILRCNINHKLIKYLIKYGAPSFLYDLEDDSHIGKAIIGYKDTIEHLNHDIKCNVGFILTINLYRLLNSKCFLDTIPVDIRNTKSPSILSTKKKFIKYVLQWYSLNKNLNKIKTYNLVNQKLTSQEFSTLEEMSKYILYSYIYSCIRNILLIIDKSDSIEKDLGIFSPSGESFYFTEIEDFVFYLVKLFAHRKESTKPNDHNFHRYTPRYEKLIEMKKRFIRNFYEKYSKVDNFLEHLDKLKDEEEENIDKIIEAKEKFENINMNREDKKENIDIVSLLKDLRNKTPNEALTTKDFKKNISLYENKLRNRKEGILRLKADLANYKLHKAKSKVLDQEANFAALEAINANKVKEREITKFLDRENDHKDEGKEERKEPDEVKGELPAKTNHSEEIKEVNILDDPRNYQENIDYLGGSNNNRYIIQ